MASTCDLIFNEEKLIQFFSEYTDSSASLLFLTYSRNKVLFISITWRQNCIFRLQLGSDNKLTRHWIHTEP